MHSFIHTGPLPAYIAFCFDEKSYLKAMKRICVKTPPPFVNVGAHGTTHTYIHPNGECCVVVCIDGKFAKKKTKTNAAGVVELMAHECVHVFQSVRERMKEGAPSSEFEAYTVAFLLRSCLDKFEEWRNKRG